MTDTPIQQPQAAPARTAKSRRGRRIMGLVLVMLVLMLCAGTFLLYQVVGGSKSGGLGLGQQVGETGLIWVRSIYGTSNEVEDQFDIPQAAIPAADGTIWAADSKQLTLMRFTPDGDFIGEVTGPDDQPIQIPSRLTFGPDGKVYVCDTPNDTVRVLSADGQTDEGSFLIPSPLSIDVNDEFMVVGSVSGFAILSLEGEPEQVIGTRGKGDLEFDYVHGVAIGEDNTIYVVDSFNNRLSAWNRDGERLWIRRLGTPSNSAEMQGDMLATQDTSDSVLPGAEALQLPLNMTLDGAGRIVLIDMFDSQIAVFDPDDGSFIARYGETGPDDGEFFYPQGIGYDPSHDWFTVADSLNNRVQIVRIPGSSGGGGVQAAVERAFAGPLRACIFPILLLILVLILWFVWSRVSKARAQRRASVTSAEASTIEADAESDSVDDAVEKE